MTDEVIITQVIKFLFTCKKELKHTSEGKILYKYLKRKDLILTLVVH